MKVRLLLARQVVRTRAPAFGLGLLVASAVAAMIILPGSWGDSDAVPRQPGVALSDEQATAPYDVAACPSRLPDVEDANLELPDLARVDAVRLCADPRDGAGMMDPPTEAEQASSVPADALVRGLGAFAATVADLPEAAPDPCAHIDALTSRTSLVFLLSDGSRVLVPTASCEEIIQAGRPVRQSDVIVAFLGALDRQRDELPVSRRVTPRLTCRTSTTDAPVNPRRERLVAAVMCEPDGTGPATLLDREGLTLLNDGWIQAAPPAVPRPTGREDDCLDLEEAPAYLLARTDRADVVRLFASPCGFLAHSPWHRGGSEEVPLTIEELRSARI